MMRTKMTLTPTARLVRLTMEKYNKAFTYVDLAVQTGCSLAALQMAVPDLLRRGHIVRTVIGGVSEFTLAPAVEASQVNHVD